MKKQKSKSKVATLLLALIVVFLFVVQLVLGGNVGGCNKEMALVEEKIDAIEKENRLLEEVISFASSLKVVQEKAIALGFSANMSLKDYRFEEPVALR